MNNIIQADVFRMRKGVAARNTFIAICITVLVLALVFVIFGNSAVQDYMLNSASTASNVLNIELTEGDKADLSQVTTMLPGNGAEFAAQIVNENILIFFFLPILLTVFCADFSAGTFRNTLSYEDNRTKVYFAKLLLSIVTCLLLVLAMLLFSWLVGGIAFGFGGFTGAYFVSLFTTLLLQLPIFLAIICFGHCLVAFTKKSGSTIGAFVVVLLVLGIIVQPLLLIFGNIGWIAMLDFTTAGKLLAQRDTLSMGTILFSVGYSLAVAVGSTALGLAHYQKTDMA